MLIALPSAQFACNAFVGRQFFYSLYKVLGLLESFQIINESLKAIDVPVRSNQICLQGYFFLSFLYSSSFRLISSLLFKTSLDVFSNIFPLTIDQVPSLPDEQIQDLFK